MIMAAGVPRVEGWFRVCSLGATDPAGPAQQLQQQHAGAPATPSGASSSAAAASTCTEYSARMAESMYTCIHHALLFLLATAPQVSLFFLVAGSPYAAWHA